MSGAELADELRRLAQAAGDLRPVVGQISEVFANAAERHFDSQGSAGWQAWSDDYAAKPYSHRGPGRSMLIRDGDLLASLADTSHRQHVRRATSATVEVGTRRPTATLHREGSRGQMPARDPMPPAGLFESRWIDALHTHITGEQGQSLGL